MQAADSSQGTGRSVTATEVQGLPRLLSGFLDTLPLAVIAVDVADGRVQAWNSAAERLFGWSAVEVLGQALPEASADRTPTFERVLRAARAEGSQGRVPVAVLRRDGRLVELDLWTAPLASGGHARTVVCLFAEPAGATAAVTLSDRAPGPRAIQAGVDAMMRGTAPTGPLQELLNRAAELMDATLGVVFRWDGRSRRLLASAVYGPAGWLDPPSWRLGDGVSGLVAAQRAGAIVNAYATSPHAHPGLLARTPVTAVVAEPLVRRDELLGVITLAEHRPTRPFTVREQGLLRLIAPQVIVGLECAGSAFLRRPAQRTLERAQVAESIRMLIEGTFARSPSAHEVAERLGVSGRSALAMFRDRFGLTPMEYLREVRLRRAQELLRATTLPVIEVARVAGFADPAYFNRVFKRALGMTPTAFRDAHLLPAAVQKSNP
jgi:PAS domain S-box-containing protein